MRLRRNPPKAGIATDYLWKEVWQRDSFLQILGRYLVPVKNAKKQLVGWIFPRYHQLTVTRKLVAAVTLERPGNKYLVLRVRDGDDRRPSKLDRGLRLGR